VLANDSDPDGDIVPGSVQVVTAPTRGSASASANGSITYTAGSNGGTDSFAYRVCDAGGRCATATVSVTITFAPVHAVNDAYTVPAGLDTVINPLANDTGPLVTSTVKVVSQSGGINVNEHADGTITVRPANGQTGTTKVLTYEVCNPAKVCSQATITLTIP
jgi:large repetitive protein